MNFTLLTVELTDKLYTGGFMKQTTTQRAMNRLSLITLILGLAVVLTFCGCGRRTNVTEVIQAPVVHQPVPVLPVSTAPATALECPAGGTDVLINNTQTVTVCNGTSGIDGQNGLNGTTITVVQFCSGTPSYPGTFPEVGLVMDGKVFGVYSANGGFLAYLPPGAYSSDGVNDSCTFTINADGSVTH